MDTTPLQTIFKFNKMVMDRNLEGISEEESLKDLPGGVSTINWVTGHAAVTRNEILKLLELPLNSLEKMESAYARGTKPGSGKPLTLSEIKKIFGEMQEAIMSVLQSEDKINKLPDDVLDKTAFFAFHESYHMGQLGILRRLLGKQGAIK